MFLDHSIFTVNCHSREISHMLIRAGQLVEQCRLSAILISCQCKCQCCSIRQWIFICFFMIFSTFSKSRMINLLFRNLILNLNLITDICNLYLFRICKPECQFITMDTKFHRITHWRVFYHGNVCPRNKSHIQKMLSQCTFSTYNCQGCTFADR